MSRSRALALLASLAVMLSTMVGATLTPTAASAASAGHYPPPPPSLVVNHGVVKRGVTVRVTGCQFRSRERVTIVIRVKPKNSHRYRTVRTFTVYADRSGNFHFTVRTTDAGYLSITATGRTSHRSASASVFVIDKHRYGHTVAMKPAAFTGSPVSAASNAAAPGTNGNVLAIAGLAVLVMTGGALITRRMVRRRKATATAA